MAGGRVTEPKSQCRHRTLISTVLCATYHGSWTPEHDGVQQAMLSSLSGATSFERDKRARSSGVAAGQAALLSRSTRAHWLLFIISGAALACLSLREPENGHVGDVDELNPSKLSNPQRFRGPTLRE